MLKLSQLYIPILFALLLPLLSSAHGEGENPNNAVKYTFIENKGQWYENAEYKAEINSGVLFLEKNTFTYKFYDATIFEQAHAHEIEGDINDFKIPYHAFKVNFVGGNPNPKLLGEEPVITRFNYFQGNDKSKWAGNCSGFRAIKYRELYPKTDLHLYNGEDGLKYDLVLQPGAELKNIRIEYTGLDDIFIENGNLYTVTSLGTMIEQKPIAFQKNGNALQEIPCEYKLKGNTITFNFPKGYDKSKELVIDPTMIFASYSGSTSNNFGYTATFDKFGFLYAGSSAFGQGYPTTIGAYDETYNAGQVDIALSKYDTTGTFFVWSTFVGGSANELPHSLIVNGDDELYVFGTTGSANYPTTTGCYDDTYNGGTALNLANGLGTNFSTGSDIIVSKISADGSQLLGSTFVGGSANDGMNNIGNNVNNAGPLRYNYADEVRGEITLQGGNVFIATCTRSTDFPIVGSPFQPTYGGGGLDGVVFNLNGDLTSMIWSSFLGAEGDDAAFSISVDSNKDMYVAGGTESDSMVVTANVVDSFFIGNRCDGFIAHIQNNGQAIINSTYWGSDEYDQNYFVELDRFDNVYVFGQTEKYDSTFIINSQYSTPGSGQFVTKFTPELDSVIWSIVFGSGTNCINISPTAFLVDLCNKIYLSGWGGGTNQLSFLTNNACNVTNMDTVGPYPAGVSSTAPNGSDFYIAVIEDDASKLVFGGFFGGPSAQEHVDGGTSRFDSKGKIYQSMCAGCGGFSDMYTSPGAVSATNNSSCNNGVFKIDFNLPLVVADFVIPPLGCKDYTIDFINTSLEQSSTDYVWYFGDGDTSIVKNPTHTYNNNGTYTITLVVTDTATCNLGDTLSQTITIIEDTSYTIASIDACPNDSVQIGIPHVDSLSYQWVPATGISDDTLANPLASAPTTTSYYLLIDDGVCTDTVFQTINRFPVSITTDPDTVICSDDLPITITGYSAASTDTFIWSLDPNFGDTLNFNLLDSSISVTPDTGYAWFYVKGISDIGCEVIDSILVQVGDLSIITDEDMKICFGDTIELSSVSGVQGDTLTYQWAPVGAIIGASDTSHILVAPEVNTTYYVTSTSSLGCDKLDTINVQVSQLKGSEVSATVDQDTIFGGGSTTLHAIPNDPNYNYLWSPFDGLSDPTSPNPVATPDETTTYTVQIVDPNFPECTKDSMVTIYVIDVICGEPDIYLPNAFTPNNDDHNDVLYVRGNNIGDLYFVIFDRWGEKVFETTDQTVGWDGTYKGKKVDPDVYAYYLEIKCLDEEEYVKKGNVTIIR